MAKTLANARYLSLATFRRSGAEVATPVWFAEHAGACYVFSSAEAGKVKRLRNSPRARIAPCDVRGKLLGDWVDARGLLVADAEESAAAYRALRAKYGLQMRVLDVFSRIGGKYHKRALIRIETGARNGRR